MHTAFDIARLAERLQDLDAAAAVRIAAAEFEHVGLAFSGAEDVVLVQMVAEFAPQVAIFCLDTGRLHPETHAFVEQVREHYGVRIEMLAPDPQRLEALVREKGSFSFYRDGHEECCAVRKIEPLRRRLAGLDAWITGQRRDQSPTRSALEAVQLDQGFRGRSGPLVKFNPLAHWSLADVWARIEALDIPHNVLHDRGFVSIGCEPCTRPVRPGQHERAGRWWWEESTRKECGLHVTRIREADIQRASRA